MQEHLQPRPQPGLNLSLPQPVHDALVKMGAEFHRIGDAAARVEKAAESFSTQAVQDAASAGFAAGCLAGGLATAVVLVVLFLVWGKRG